MTDPQLEQLFRKWWAESYHTPPGPHALMTHIGWARFLAQKQVLSLNIDRSRRPAATSSPLNSQLLPRLHFVPTDSELEILFRTWWQQSYHTPPGPHALMTHIGWARFLLQQQGQQQQREQQR